MTVPAQVGAPGLNSGYVSPGIPKNPKKAVMTGFPNERNALARTRRRNSILRTGRIMRPDGVSLPGSARRPFAPSRPSRGLAIAFALAVSAGAASGREKPLRNAARDVADRVASVLGVGECAKGVLSRHGLLAAALVDPGGAALRLEGASVCGSEREPDIALTLAELWYRDALRRPRHDPASAVPPLRAAAAAAALALANPSAGCCDRAVLVHNDAVSRLIRISQDACVPAGQHPSAGLASLGVVATATDPFVDPGRFADVVLADDVRVTRIRHRFRTDGLGVPVVGTRCVDRSAPAETDERFFPAQLRIAATVLARPGGGLEGAAYRRLPLSLVFHDPFRVGSARVGGRALTLATDRTAQLAMQASQDRLRSEAIRGVLTTEFDSRIEPGLYMLRPYAPGKIPVVFIHGLAATPVAFLQEINDFSNDPALAARYQFWVFAYPTGAMVARSAQRLREALDAAESAYGADPAFRRMVLVGHSMGGILAHMIVSDSGRAVWDGALSVPPEGLRASPATRAARPVPVLSPPPLRAPGGLHRHPPPREPTGERCARPVLRRPDPAGGRVHRHRRRDRGAERPRGDPGRELRGRFDQRDRQPQGR